MEFTGERYIPNVIDSDDEISIEHIQRYEAIQKIVVEKKVLDAACGEGYGAYMLAQFATQVIGIDIDNNTIEEAQRKYLESNLSYVNSSIESLPFEDNSFDVVVSFETIEHVDGNIQANFLSEIKRVLKPNGVLIMSTPNKSVYSDLRNYTNPFHVKEFYQDEFYNFLKSKFHSVQFFYQYRESAFLLTGRENSAFEHVKLKKNTSNLSKYIIAVCSNDSTQFNLNSIFIENDSLQLKIERILRLQQEVEERNAHIQKLDKEIEEKNKHIDYLRVETNTQNQIIKELKSDILITEDFIKEKEEQLSNVNKKFQASEKKILNEMKNSENQKILEEAVERFKHQVNILNGENETLKQKENLLLNIYNSDGWKLLLKYYKLRDKIFSPKGKMRLIAKLSKRVIVERNFKLVSSGNIKKFFYYYKNQDLSMLENRVDDYISRNTTALEVPITIQEINEQYDKLVFPIFEKPKVSIIIPVYNQWHYTYACLKSILTCTNDVTYEILLADDESSDETVNAAQYIENVKIIRDGTNRGFLLNCNNAAHFASGEYIFFLNNDTQVQERWLDSLVELIESDKKIGMVGSKLVYPDGRLQEAGGIIWNDASGWNFGRLDDPTKPEYSYVKEVDYISGAAILIRSSLWKEIGGFDERYIPAYFEDSDLAFEVRKHGFKVILQPKSVVVHFEGISHGTNVNEGIKNYQVQNKAKFIEKWQHVLTKDHFDNGQHVFLARDRSRSKKMIVVVDHYVPHWDKDAGSRTTYQYLKMFIQMGFNVKFIGDNFYKHEPYSTELEKLGIEILCNPYNLSNIQKWFKENSSYIDYVYLNRPHIAVKYIDFIRKYTKAKILYYGHDLHFLRELREYEVTGEPSLLNSSKEWKKKELDLYNKSDVVYYPSQIEIDEIHKINNSIIARAIPAYIFDKKEIQPINKDRCTDLLFVGGFGHKPNVDAVLWFVENVFNKLIKDKPNMRFYVVGSNPPDIISNLASDNIIVTGFVTDEELNQYYKQTRIVVVPLRYGAGVKGKVVEALYNGSAIITTDVGAEGIPNSHNVLTIANTAEEFEKEIIDLYEDNEKIKKLAIESVKYINNNYTIDAVKTILKNDIQF